MYTYSPSDISITFAGVPIDGFDASNVVRINRIDPIYTSKRAMDGTVSITKQKYSKWQVSIFLAQSSDSNDLLNGIQKLLFSSNIKAMQFLPLIIKDNSGTTMFFAKDVWIEQLPELEFGQSLAVREWVFMCNDVECIIGGNAEDLTGITEALAIVSLLQSAYEGSKSVVRTLRSL